MALGAFLALAVTWTWPLARHVSSRVAPDPGDPVLNTWILWWNSQAIPFTERWWNPPIFFPMDGAFALSEHLAGIALFTVPFQLAGLSPLAAANAALILSFALSAFFTYLLVCRLLASSRLPPLTIAAAAFCAGMAFGFAPYRISQLSHLQVLTTQWMPLALLGMHGYLADGRWRWLALTAFAWVVQALSNGYYLIFFPVLVAVWFAWFVGVGRHWRRGAALLGAYAVASLLLLPGLLQYLAVHQQLGLERHVTEMRMFSGDLRAFLTPPHGLVFWPDLAFANQETFLFPGVTALALVALALVLRRRVPLTVYPLLFYATAALLMWWLSLGPALPDDGFPARLRPYTLLAELPGFGGLRVPARIAMLGYMCLAIAAGLALARLLPRAPAARGVVLAVVVAGLFIDSWPTPMPVLPPPGRILLPDVATTAAVLELPADDEQVNVSAMYRAMHHGRPLVNGYSGHVPRHYRIVRDGLRRGDHSILAALAIRRPLVVSVDPARDADGHFRRVVEAVGAQPLGVTNAGSLYLVPAQPSVVRPPVGDPLTYTQSHPAHDIAELDLGRPETVRVLGFPLRWHYPELHSRLEITASDDRETWTVVWIDWTGSPALLGALDDQREVPFRITLPDVRARYLRVRPLPPALMREIAVYGPR